MAAPPNQRAEARIDRLTSFPGEARRPFVSLVGFLLAVLGFAATATALGAMFDAHPGVRAQEGSYQRSKAVYFAAHADEYDMVFLGSSQVWRHVLPPVVEEELARAGHRIKSFNLGLPGATFPEVLSRGLELASEKPERLRWVVCELRPVFPKLYADNELSLRQVGWHTPAATRALVPAVWGSERSFAQRLARVRLHLRHAAYRWAGVGLFLPTVRRTLGMSLDVDPSALVVHGAKPIDVEARTRPELNQRAREFIRARGELPERVAELAAAEPRAALASEAALLRLFTDRLREAGIEPVFFLNAPTWVLLSEFEDLHARGEIPSLFAYNDPERFPEFYSVEHLFDFGHMRTSGAELFSRRLARDLAGVLASPPATKSAD